MFLGSSASCNKLLALITTLLLASVAKSQDECDLNDEGDTFVLASRGTTYFSIVPSNGTSDAVVAVDNAEFIVNEVNVLDQLSTLQAQLDESSAEMSILQAQLNETMQRLEDAEQRALDASLDLLCRPRQGGYYNPSYGGAGVVVHNQAELDTIRASCPTVFGTLYLSSFIGATANLSGIVNITHKLVVADRDYAGDFVSFPYLEHVHADTLVALGSEEYPDYAVLDVGRGGCRLKSISFPALTRVDGGGILLARLTYTNLMDFSSLEYAARIEIEMPSNEGSLTSISFPSLTTLQGASNEALKITNGETLYAFSAPLLSTIENALESTIKFNLPKFDQIDLRSLSAGITVYTPGSSSFNCPDDIMAGGATVVC